MSKSIQKPAHIKFRREVEGGLVYDHERYGEEDATLTEVSETVIEVLEAVEAGRDRSELEQVYGSQTIATLLEAGILDE